MGSTNWCRRSLAAGCLLLAAAAASAQLYQHPRSRWKIDFPAGWAVSAETERGAAARAPRSAAALVVAKVRTSAPGADAWDRSAQAARRRPYAKCRDSHRAEVELRGKKALRVEFDCADKASGRAVRGWRTVLFENGIVDEISYEAAPGDDPRLRAAAEAALRSFLPDFGPAGLEAIP